MISDFRKVCFGTVLACCVSSASAQQTPFFFGHEDLPEGCHADSSIEDVVWSEYLALLEERLRRPVQGCGVHPVEAISKLSAGELDFAFVKTDSSEAELDGIRPILRIKPEDMAPRTEVVILGAMSSSGQMEQSALGLPQPSVKRFAAFTMQELVALTAVSESLLMDDSRVRNTARQIAGPLADEWPDVTPLNNPVETINQMDETNSDIALYLTQGRYHELCMSNEVICSKAKKLWRGFPAISAAFAVPANTPHDTVYRLIGIHIAMDVERPDLFRAIGGEAASEFEPTDPYALRFMNSL